MKLGKYELKDWERSSGGWFRPDMNNKIVICAYHNLIEKCFQFKDIPDNAIYNKGEEVLWSVLFRAISSSSGNDEDMNNLTRLYHMTNEMVRVSEDVIKNNIDRFIIKTNKLLIFA